jgi:hypothetical protein
VLTKEEYIPLVPIFVLFVLHCKWLLLHRIFPSVTVRQFAFALGAVYLTCSVASLGILFGFRYLNEVNHAVRAAYHFGSLMQNQTWIEISRVTLLLVLPVGPLLMLGLWNRTSLAMSALLFYCLAFPIGRGILNSVVYGSPAGSPWGNVVIPPGMFVAVLGVIALVTRTHTLRGGVLSTMLAIGVSIALCAALASRTATAQDVRDFLRGAVASRFDPVQVEEIRARVPAAAGVEYIVTEEFLMRSFMDYSHVSIDWLAQRSGATEQRVLLGARFVILAKKNPIAWRLTSHPDKFFRVSETTDLICFRPLNARLL